MSEESYLSPPEKVDMVQAERAIRRASLVSLLALAVVVPIGYVLLPWLFEFPADLALRLAFAAQGNRSRNG